MDGIHHIALRVRDCHVAARFYEQTLGLTETRRIEAEGEIRAVWFRAGASVLMLERSLRGKGEASGSGHVLVFPTTDISVAGRRLEQLGILVTDRTPSTLYFQDPDGHRLGLSEYRFDLGTS